LSLPATGFRIQSQRDTCRAREYKKRLHGKAAKKRRRKICPQKRPAGVTKNPKGGSGVVDNSEGITNPHIPSKKGRASVATRKKGERLKKGEKVDDIEDKKGLGGILGKGESDASASVDPLKGRRFSMHRERKGSHLKMCSELIVLDGRSRLKEERRKKSSGRVLREAAKVLINFGQSKQKT